VVTAPANPYKSYLKTTVETASQPQLLVMLFDAAVKKLRIARKAIQDKKIEVSHNELIKVQKIFSELMVALDFDLGGDLAQQLFAIYDFVYRQLVQANVRRDIQLIDEVMPIVEDLREGWTKAVQKFQEEEQKNGGKPAPAGTAKSRQPSTGGREQGQTATPPKAKPQQPSPVNSSQQKSAQFGPISPSQLPKSKPQPKRYGFPSTPPDDPGPGRLNIQG